MEQNQLNLPAGRPVIVHLSSKDVIHSFAPLQMRVKQDAIPGVEQRLWFTPPPLPPAPPALGRQPLTPTR